MPEGKVLESGYLYLGRPAKPVRPLTEAELKATNFLSQTFLTDTRTLRFYYRLLKGNRAQS